MGPRSRLLPSVSICCLWLWLWLGCVEGAVDMDAVAPAPAGAGSGRSHVPTPWTNLKVGFPSFSSSFYESMPRHVYAIAHKSQSEWINLSAGECTNGGRYNGFRFIERSGKRGPSIALLYDVQGTVAGIQMILDKATAERKNDFHFDKVPFYNPDTLQGQDAYVITVYFVDPQTICKTGRNRSELSSPGGSGTGTALFVQNGTSPDNLLFIPRSRTKAFAEGWSRNECFVGMGHHNFYKMDEWAKTNCQEIVPVFGMYDNFGHLTGFGFLVVGQVWRRHFENLPPLLWLAGSQMIVGLSAPKCFLEKSRNQGLTTMHVFFTDYPQLFTCLRRELLTN